MSRLTAFVGVWSLCGAVLVSCSSEVATPGDPEGSVRERAPVVAFVGTLSGGGTWRGKPALRGMRTALEGLGEEQLRLQVLDDRGKRAVATRLVRRVAANDDVAGVVYAGVPRGLPPAEDALADAGIPAFLCYGDLSGAGRLPRHVFQMGPEFEWEIDLLVERAQTLGADAPGLLVEDSLMGKTARNAFREEMRREEIVFRAVEVFSPTVLEDLPEHLRRLRSAGVNHVFVEASPVEFGRIAGYMRELDWSPTLLSMDLTLSPALRGPAAPIGSIAVDLETRAAHLIDEGRLASFAAAAEESTGQLPLWWEHRAYEAVRMLVRAVGSAEGQRDLAQVLEDPGLDMGFTRRDHVAPEREDVGLWERVGPGSGSGIPRLLPWRPLFELDSASDPGLRSGVTEPAPSPMSRERALLFSDLERGGLEATRRLGSREEVDVGPADRTPAELDITGGDSPVGGGSLVSAELG